MSLDRHRILITGAGGLIGRHLAAAAVSSGAQVVLLDWDAEALRASRECVIRSVDKDCEIVVADVGDAVDVPLLRHVTSVVHLAASVSVSDGERMPAFYHDNNTTKTVLLLERLKIHNPCASFILASSRAVYGEGPYRCASAACKDHVQYPRRSSAQLERGQWEPRCELCGGAAAPSPCDANETAVNPISVYARTKLAQEDAARRLVADDRLTILRLQNVYGQVPPIWTESSARGVADVLLMRIIRKRPIWFAEDGHQTRDFVHVDDVVNELVRAIGTERANGEEVVVRDVGTGKAHSLQDLSKRIADASETPIAIESSRGHLVGDIRHARCGTSARGDAPRKLEVLLPQLARNLRCVLEEAARMEETRGGCCTGERG